MARVKGGNVSKNRRRKVLKRAKGYFGSKHRLYKTAQEQLFHSGAYSFNDRKKRANDFRKLWITRINAACRANDIVYSKFINGLKKANIEINRKMLSELAIFAPEEFTKLVKLSKDALEGKAPKKEAKEVEATEDKVEAPAVETEAAFHSWVQSEKSEKADRPDRKTRKNIRQLPSWAPPFFQASSQRCRPLPLQVLPAFQ